MCSYVNTSVNVQSVEGNSVKLQDRARLEELLRHRFFYLPSFEIYGGIAGLYDMGPIGSALESNIVSVWRQHFVIEDGMLEVRCSQLTPHVVLEASGHVERFTDVMVKDVITGECFRCDHLLKSHFERLLSDDKNTAPEMQEQYRRILAEMDNYSGEDLGSIINKHGVVSPTTGNALSEPKHFNLMFPTSIGPTGVLPGFMRPETAQGIFVNFKRLLEFNNNRVPFVAAQVGSSFRNEISPRSGLLRSREFLMAEIEHFVHPDHKNHPKFDSVSNMAVQLFPSRDQLAGKSPHLCVLADAVHQGIVANNVLAYYLGRIQLFLSLIGIDSERVRFRQHLPNEMAHYACDCWDCEIHTTYGWIECVGCADRSCFDLHQHSKMSGSKLCAQEILSTPTLVKYCDVVLDKGKIGREFKANAPLVISHLESLDSDQADLLNTALSTKGCFTIKVEKGGNSFTVSRDMVKSVVFTEREVCTRDYQPHVIEPSFGIGRILYAVLEHSFRVRANDSQRLWFKFPLCVAPVKCAVLPLSKKKELEPLTELIGSQLGKCGISYKIDDVGATIGKRYSRNDEIAIPYAITIDFDSINVQPPSVTLRERDTTEQIRIDADVVASVVLKLVRGETIWQNLVQKYGLFVGQTSI